MSIVELGAFTPYIHVVQLLLLSPFIVIYLVSISMESTKFNAGDAVDSLIIDKENSENNPLIC